MYGIEEKKYIGHEVKILDKGFVRLVDYMGSDDLVVRAARISYNNKGKSKDEALIDYLIRNEHLSPFEMVEFIFHVKVPIFVARQIFRHRTASFNEISGRYVQLKEEFFIPSEFRSNTKSNKQESEEVFDQEKYNSMTKTLETIYENSKTAYNDLLNLGLARELARTVLPLGTYTEFFYKQDLRNLLHFIRLRLDAHAQKEVRSVAEAFAFFVKNIVPITWDAFERNVLKSVRITSEDLDYIDLRTLSLKKEPPSKTKKEELLRLLNFLTMTLANKENKELLEEA